MNQWNLLLQVGKNKMCINQKLANLSTIQKKLLDEKKLLLLGDGSLVNNGATTDELTGSIDPTFIYFIFDGELTKIGKSDNPEKRVCSLQTGNGKKLSLINTIKCKTQEKGFILESKLHAKFKKYRKQGEWFAIPEELQKEWKELE